MHFEASSKRWPAMPGDPAAILDLLDRVEAAFDTTSGDSTSDETGLDPGTNESNVIQLRKACRLLEAC